jgi:hypothetical protein
MSTFFNIKKLSVLIAVFVLLATISSPVFAAGKMKSLEVQVWPEYDQPSVLVMFAAQDISGTKKVTIYYPKGAQVNKVLNKILTANDNQDSFNQKFTSKETTNDTEVSFDLPGKQYFSEGYWDVLKGQKTQKSFTFDLKLPMDVDNVYVYIQQPATASNFTVDPKPQAMQQDPQNKLSVAGYQFQNKKAGEVIPLKVSYTKTNDTLSVNQANGQASQTSAPTSSTAASSDVTIIMLVIFGLLLLVAGGFAFYNYQQNSSGNKKSAAKKPMKTGQKSKINYCPNCGARAEGKFCAKCGERL